VLPLVDAAAMDQTRLPHNRATTEEAGDRRVSQRRT
jgi:hypothetical protein